MSTVAKISGKCSPLVTALSEARSRLAGLMEDASVPTNLKPIARQLGVMGLRRSDLDVAAMLIPHASGYLAVVNRNNSRGLQRFALAHEIGHLLLNAVDDRLGTRHRAPSLRGSHDEVEVACDQLATDMLMPREPVMKIGGARWWRLDAVLAIRDEFIVGIEKAAARMIELSPLRHAMVTWRRGVRNEPDLVREPLSNVDHPRVLGLDRTASIIDIPSACKAYTQDGTFRGSMPFTVLWTQTVPSQALSLPTESRGFGVGEHRHVRSLAYLGNRHRKVSA